MRTTGIDTTCRRRSGFTLIEMLVVIVIMVILMGVVFKLSKGAMAKSTYAKELKRVAILRTLIEEFHAEYSTYPPVPEYEMGDKRVQPVNFTGAYPLDGDTADLHYYPSSRGYSPVEGCYFVFGLMSAFVDRSEYCSQVFNVINPRGSTEPNSRDNIPRNQWREYNDLDWEYVEENGKRRVKIVTPDKDKAFVKRVTPIVRQIYDGNKYVEIDPEAKDGQPHSKGFSTRIYDSWGHSYVYISKPPYTTYLIFSAGPDGKYDEERPGDRAAEKNRDNIYGNLGDK